VISEIFENTFSLFSVEQMIFLYFDLSIERIKKKTFLNSFVTDQLIIRDVTVVVSVMSFDLKSIFHYIIKNDKIKAEAALCILFLCFQPRNVITFQMS